MSINEFNRMRKLFGADENLKAYFIKLKNYINIDGYDRREFHDARNIHFDDSGYVYFSIENWREFKSEEVKLPYTEVLIFVPSNDKKSKKLPFYLQDINLKEGEFINLNKK